jgi:hypothetical protein
MLCYASRLLPQLHLPELQLPQLLLLLMAVEW